MKKFKFIVVFFLFALAMVVTGAVAKKDAKAGAGAAANGQTTIRVPSKQPIETNAPPPPPLRDELAFRAFQELVNQFDR